MRRLYFLLAIILALASVSVSQTNGDCGPSGCTVVQAAAKSGWEFHPEWKQSIFFRDGVQVAGWDHERKLYRTLDSGVWSEPKQPPWATCPCGCGCEDCQCANGKPCGCDTCGLAPGAVKNPTLALNLPSEIREWYWNPDGSCVQCSIGMVGADQNIPEASTLLWDTEYGKAERGGSWPQRVSEYAKRRGIKCYNVTGESTWDWMRWAALTGRGCAIGASSQHFQTLVGYDPSTKQWSVCNNQHPKTIETYTDEQFRRLHLASGQWCVVLDAPPAPANPEPKKWWNAVASIDGFGAPPEVERDAILRLGNMVQVIGEIGDDADSFVEAMAPPADDSQKWFISIVSMQGCAPCARLKRDWATSDDLQAFAKPADSKNSWAHFTVYDKDDQSQAFRFLKTKVSQYPTVIIQPPRSGVFGDPSTIVFQKAGYDGNANKLASAMSAAIKRYAASLPKSAGTGQRRPPFTPPPKVTPPDLTPPAPTPTIPPEIPPPPPLLPPEPANETPWAPWVVGGLVVLAFLKGRAA